MAKKIVDLSPAVPHGFKGPPSTDLGVQMNVRTKTDPGFWMSTQLELIACTRGRTSRAHCTPSRAGRP